MANLAQVILQCEKILHWAMHPSPPLQKAETDLLWICAFSIYKVSLKFSEFIRHLPAAMPLLETDNIYLSLWFFNVISRYDLIGWPVTEKFVFSFQCSRTESRCAVMARSLRNTMLY